MDDDTFDPGPAALTDAAGQTTNGNGDGYAQELTSKKIMARQRTFYIDLKESHNGKFIKISEISRGGQRSTIMFDIEDLDEFLKALEDLKKQA